MYIMCTYAICQTGLDFFPRSSFTLFGIAYSNGKFDLLSFVWTVPRTTRGDEKYKTPFSALCYTVLYIYTQYLHIAHVIVTIIVIIIIIIYI